MNPVAIVTGAGSGIGRATARVLSANGYAVSLVGRNDSSLRDTASQLTGPSLVIAADISDAAACEQVISRTETTFRRIDALVNNAGVAPLAPIEDTEPAMIAEVFGVNALGPAYLIHYAWPAFLRQRRSCIVNVSTMGTIDPFPGFFAYAAAKASVNLMVVSCAKEGLKHGIRAFAVAPGAVETTMLRGVLPDLPVGMALSPDAVAAVIVDCVLGRRNEENGKVIVLPSPS